MSASLGGRQPVEAPVEVVRDVADLLRAPALARDRLPARHLRDEAVPVVDDALVAPVRLRGMALEAGGVVEKPSTPSVRGRRRLRAARRGRLLLGGGGGTRGQGKGQSEKEVFHGLCRVQDSYRRHGGSRLLS